jgi:hypothetical protein
MIRLISTASALSNLSYAVTTLAVEIVPSAPAESETVTFDDRLANVYI